METILIVDEDSARADLICEMLNTNDVAAERCQSIIEIRRTIESTERPAVLVIHCDLLNQSFTEIARLRHHPHVKLIFYCTDPGQRSPGTVAQLPEELTEIILKITESKRKLQIAS